MSQPDLKILAESLFYKHGIFPINEQDDCRETAQNLVDFLQCLRLIVREKLRCCFAHLIEMFSSMKIDRFILLMFFFVRLLNNQLIFL